MHTHLGIGLKVVVQNIDTDGQVSGVIRIGAVPSLGTKLAPLDHNSVEVDEGEEDAFELILTRTHLQCVLMQR